MSDKNTENVDDTPKKESAPEKASVNITIGEDWGDNTNYSSLMVYQVTEDTVPNKTLKMEYQHVMSYSGGNMSPT